jgi:hypothetical protein
MLQAHAAARFRSPNLQYILLLYVALVTCTPPHLVTLRILANSNQDWCLVLRLANLDAQQRWASRRRLQGMRMLQRTA